jgi:hypothetical protein
VDQSFQTDIESVLEIIGESISAPVLGNESVPAIDSQEADIPTPIASAPALLQTTASPMVCIISFLTSLDR